MPPGNKITSQSPTISKMLFDAASVNARDSDLINEAHHKGRAIKIVHASLNESPLFQKMRESIWHDVAPKSAAARGDRISLGETQFSKLKEKFDVAPQVRIATQAIRLSHGISKREEKFLLQGKALPQVADAGLSAEEEIFLGLAKKPLTVSERNAPSQAADVHVDEGTSQRGDASAPPSVISIEAAESPVASLEENKPMAEKYVKKSMRGQIQSFFSGLMKLVSKIFQKTEPQVKR